MIFKSYELNKINNDKFNFFLFYGKNNYQKKIEFNNLIESNSEVIKYEEKDLIDRQNEIIENILSRSLFQKKKNYFNQKIY